MTEPTSSKPAEKKSSFNKALRRASLLLRKGRSKSSGEPSKASSSSKPSSTQPPVTHVSKEAPQLPPIGGVSSLAKPKVLSRSEVQQERAKKLMEKYGLTLDPGEWTASLSDKVERVEKPIRLRVRRQCHKCNTTFGGDKICSKCQHHLCKKCPRHPPKKKPLTAAEKAKKKGVLSIPAKVGGQDRIYHPVVQRIHRTCHECKTSFAVHSKQCEKCGHARCSKCPRDPAKPKKFPHGYPGDVDYGESEAEMPLRPRVPNRQYKKIRMRVRWLCHECNSTFIAHSKTCANCNHQRCPNCPRVPPKKVKPEPDPEVVKRVQEKLAALRLGEHRS